MNKNEARKKLTKKLSNMRSGFAQWMKKNPNVVEALSLNHVDIRPRYERKTLYGAAGLAEADVVVPAYDEEDVKMVMRECADRTKLHQRLAYVLNNPEVLIGYPAHHVDPEHMSGLNRHLAKLNSRLRFIATNPDVRWNYRSYVLGTLKDTA